MISEDKYFKLFANCIPVKGYRRSIICDLHNENFVFIPNDLYKILNDYYDRTIFEIKRIYENKYDEIVESYFTFLIEKNFIFFCEKDELEFFPNIDLSWDEPSPIANAIIENDSNSNHDFQNIFMQLDELLCNNIQLKFYNNIRKKELIDILVLLEDTAILIVEVVMFNTMNFLTNDYKEIFKKFTRLRNVYLHNSDEFKIIPFTYSNSNLIYLKNDINGPRSCGNIHPNYFSINTKQFTESLNFNTCLNRKISVDKKGEIRNCPLMDISYGNINKIKLKEIINLKSFQEKWRISKDKIEICRDCEFRYICTDCRTNIEDIRNIYSKPKNCPYNTYTAKGF